jgi:hypothetical protein
MWPLIVMTVIVTFDLAYPVELGQGRTEITLISRSDDSMRPQFKNIVNDPEENVVLRLSNVEADEEPGSSWEVYVASSEKEECGATPTLIGMLSLYGAPTSADFVFPLDEAIAGGDYIGLKVIFKPTSGIVVEGNAEPAKVRTAVRIGKISLETDKATGDHD